MSSHAHRAHREEPSSCGTQGTSSREDKHGSRDLEDLRSTEAAFLGLLQVSILGGDPCGCHWEGGTQCLQNSCNCIKISNNLELKG